MKCKLSLKLLVALATRIEGLTYKEISGITHYHVNTVSRYISYLDNKGIIDIDQKKSSSVRGRKWVNVVKLKREFLEANNCTDFFNRVLDKLEGEFNDVFAD